jgi:hypothetical protein
VREYLLDLWDRFATDERKSSCSSTETRDGPGTGGSGKVGGPVGGGFAGLGMCDGGDGNASRRTRWEWRMMVVGVVDGVEDIVFVTGMVGLAQ